MSDQKKKKVAQVAVESEQSQDSSKDVQAEPSQEAVVSSVPFDLSKIDPKKVALAEEMGIPISQLIKWTASVEERFNIIMQNLADAPQKVVEALKSEAVKNQTEQIQRMREQGGQGRSGGLLGGLSELMPLVSAFGGSSSSNPFQDKMMEMMFQKTIQGMDLSNALTKAMIIKLAPSLADELTKTIIAPSEKETIK